MCSRKKANAELIVASLLSGDGYSEEQIMVPACDATSWQLSAGAVEDAAGAEVIVLCSPFDYMWTTLEPITPLIKGKGKIFLDLTNPWLGSSGIEPGLPQSSVQLHKQKLDDPTAKWAMCYRHLLWLMVLPTGPSPKAAGNGIEVLGEAEAVAVASRIIAAHGFRPVERGGLESAPDYEMCLKVGSA